MSSFHIIRLSDRHNAFLRANMHRPDGRRSNPNRRRNQRSQRVLILSFCRPASKPSFVYRVARIAGRTILSRNGVIRNIVYMGEMQLPQEIKKHGARHILGHYFLMRFYGAPYLVKDLGRHLALDPRTLRHNVIKLGDKYGFPLKDNC